MLKMELSLSVKMDELMMKMKKTLDYSCLNKILDMEWYL